METLIQDWLTIWLYVISGIGIYLVWLTYKNRKNWSTINILCTLAVVVLVLHVLEEWVLPGGLHYSYNLSHGADILSCYPMNRLTDMITNFGGIVLGVVVLKVWGFRKPAAIAIMLFSLFEVVIHVMIGISSLETFLATTSFIAFTGDTLGLVTLVGVVSLTGDFLGEVLEVLAWVSLANCFLEG